MCLSSTCTCASRIPFLFFLKKEKKMLELFLTLSNHSTKVLEKVQEVVGGKSVDEVLKEEEGK